VIRREEKNQNKRIHCYLALILLVVPTINPPPRPMGSTHTLQSLHRTLHLDAMARVDVRWQTSKGSAGQVNQDSAVQSVGKKHVH
jgi:hypothetical protein